MMTTDSYHSQSRIWLYLSDRPLTDMEVNDINLALKHFAKEWTAHGANLKAHGEILYNRFIVLMVDESDAGASGCSIDKSVHFIQMLERKYNVSLFNRMLVAYQENNEVKVVDANKAKQLIENGEWSEDTRVFNTLVQTKDEFDNHFVIPLKESWLSRFLRPVIS